MGTDELQALADLLHGGPAMVLSGAGISTDSGIPDYRGDGSEDRRRRPPISYREFMREPLARRRYWGRSHVGFRHVATAAPNDGHRAVATLQELGLVSGVVTQNVDGLHQRAGSTGVLDLHGRLDQVICTSCRTLRPRREVARRLADANPDFEAAIAGTDSPFAPDGDADLADHLLSSFRTVDCERCGGLLKPDVVFFGESLPAARRDLASSVLADARGLLVLGSSLAVMSGYRLVLQAANAGQPVAIVTRGPSRGDHLADVRIDDGLTPTLTALLARLDLTARTWQRPAGVVGHPAGR